MLLYRIRIAADMIPWPLPARRSHQIPLASLLMTESEVEKILALDPTPEDLLGDPCVWGRFRAGRVRQAPSPHLPRTNITCVRPSAPPMAQAARRKTGHQGKHRRHRRSSWPGKRGQPPEWPGGRVILVVDQRVRVLTPGDCRSGGAPRYIRVGGLVAESHVTVTFLLMSRLGAPGFPNSAP